MRTLLRQLEEATELVVAVSPWATSTLDSIGEIADAAEGDEYEAELRAVARAYRGGRLHIAPADVDLVCMGLIELVNSEDAQAEETKRTDPEGAKLARKASDALSALATKVRRMAERTA